MAGGLAAGKELGDTRAIESITPLLKDEKADVRKEAENALAKLKKE